MFDDGFMRSYALAAAGAGQELQRMVEELKELNLKFEEAARAAREAAQDIGILLLGGASLFPDEEGYDLFFRSVFKRGNFSGLPVVLGSEIPSCGMAGYEEL